MHIPLSAGSQKLLCSVPAPVCVSELGREVQHDAVEAQAASLSMSSSCPVQAPAAKLSMTEKERLLPKLVEEGWLADVPEQQGTYSIGVRNPFPADCHGRHLLA